MNKSLLLIIALFFMFTGSGSAQNLESKTRPIHIVSELTMAKKIPFKNEGSSSQPYDIGVNLGFDKNFRNNAGLGLHVFCNTAMRAGVRGRISQFNDKRKIFDASIGLALNRLEDAPFDVEASFYFDEKVAVFARLDISNYTDSELSYYGISGGTTKRELNLGLKFNSVKALGTAAAGGLVLLGLALHAITNSI